MAFRKKHQDPFREIQVCLQKRDYKGALDWFNTLLKKDPKNTQIRLRFADTLVLGGSKHEAVKQYGIVADELAEKGFMIRAIAINKKILQLDPSQTDVHEKLASMKEERTAPSSKAALSDVLFRPGDPLRRSSPPPAGRGPERSSEPTPAAPSAPVPPPSRPADPPPSAAPELSLEESMAMEFGSNGEISPSAEPGVGDDAPGPAVAAGGGFELVDEEAPSQRRESAIPDEPPSFAEEPIEFGASAGDAEVVEIVADDSEAAPEVELSLPGVEPPPSDGAEIVLELDEGKRAGALPTLEAESLPETAEGLVEDEEPEEEEIEVVALEVESEPALAADGAESLIDALGEDIDSLIDSIIDDVGSSASGAEPKAEPAPTHIPLFSDLTTSEFIAVAILLVRRVAKTGEVIVGEGDPGDSMFIVSTGEVRADVLRDGQQVTVATMREGDFFGEMAVLSGEPRTATVTAVKATELLELSRENLREICSRHPHVEAKIRLAYDERVAGSEP